jgi:hypothetical protein
MFVGDGKEDPVAVRHVLVVARVGDGHERVDEVEEPEDQEHDAGEGSPSRASACGRLG